MGLREVLTVYQRLGIRHRCRLAFVAAYLSEPQLLDLARAADLYALVDLAAKRELHPVAGRAHDLLAAIARTGDLHAVPADA